MFIVTGTVFLPSVRPNTSGVIWRMYASLPSAAVRIPLSSPASPVPNQARRTIGFAA